MMFPQRHLLMTKVSLTLGLGSKLMTYLWLPNYLHLPELNARTPNTNTRDMIPFQGSKL
jgi:hypothetical protein